MHYNKMGSSSSQFEDQFYNLYHFVNTIEDPTFSRVKIYRKRKFAFDYMMVVDTPISQLAVLGEPNRSNNAVQERLALIRRHQNHHTVQLEYAQQLNQYGCGSPMMRLYIQYYNHTLLDYLSALRTHGLHLTLQELRLVLRSVTEAVLVIRKMKIDGYQITLQNIYVSIDQAKVTLNPTLFLYQGVRTVFNKRAFRSLCGEYANCHEGDSEQQQLGELRRLVLEMSRYLSREELRGSVELHQQLLRLRMVEEILQFRCDCQELKLQQFGQSGSEQGDLYDRQGQVSQERLAANQEKFPPNL